MTLNSRGDSESEIEAGQRLSVQSALERAQLSNSMSRMRANLKQGATLYLTVPNDRRDVQNRELKALLDRVDPLGVGRLCNAMPEPARAQPPHLFCKDEFQAACKPRALSSPQMAWAWFSALRHFTRLNAAHAREAAPAAVRAART